MATEPVPTPRSGEVLVRVLACEVPHRPARDGGRSARAPGLRHAGARGGRRGRRRTRGGRRAPRTERARRCRVAARYVWHVPLLPTRRGEPVSELDVHRLGCRRRLRRFLSPHRWTTCTGRNAGTPMWSWRLCCARGSSATARLSGRSCRRAAGSASTGSVPVPISPRRSRSPAARGTCAQARTGPRCRARERFGRRAARTPRLGDPVRAGG